MIMHGTSRGGGGMLTPMKCTIFSWRRSRSKRSSFKSMSVISFRISEIATLIERVRETWYRPRYTSLKPPVPMRSIFSRFSGGISWSNSCRLSRSSPLRSSLSVARFSAPGSPRSAAISSALVQSCRALIPRATHIPCNECRRRRPSNAGDSPSVDLVCVDFDAAIMILLSCFRDRCIGTAGSGICAFNVGESGASLSDDKLEFDSAGDSEPGWSDQSLSFSGSREPEGGISLVWSNGFLCGERPFDGLSNLRRRRE